MRNFLVLVNSTGFLFQAPHATPTSSGSTPCPPQITRQLSVDSDSSPKTTWQPYCSGRTSPTVTGSEPSPTSCSDSERMYQLISRLPAMNHLTQPSTCGRQGEQYEHAGPN